MTEFVIRQKILYITENQDFFVSSHFRTHTHSAAAATYLTKMIKDRTFKVGNRNWIKLHCYCFYRYRSSNMKRILIQVYEYEIKLKMFSSLCWFVILRRKEMKDDIFVKLNDMGAIMMTTRKSMLIWKNFAAVQSADVYQSACN